MTPSAPRSNALVMKCGLIRLLQGARIIRTFGDILSRLVPARSAPVYVHQLQTKATTFGEKGARVEAAGGWLGALDMASPPTVERLRGAARRPARRSLHSPS